MSRRLLGTYQVLRCPDPEPIQINLLGSFAGHLRSRDSRHLRRHRRGLGWLGGRSRRRF